MSLLATAAWTLAGTRHRTSRWLDKAMGLVAMVAVLATTAAGIMEQAEAEREDAAAQQSAQSAEDLARLALPTRETMIAGYFGAPYTYSSDVHLKKPGAHDFTAKDVDWEGQPFKSPIYYGARVVRWFDGGRRGAMIDFTHSKALAMMDQESAFEGTLANAPLPAKAALKDIYRKLEFSHGHNMLTLNGLWRLASLAPRLSPYVGIGVGVNLPHSEVQLKTVRGRTYEYQYTGPAAQAVIGLEFRVPRMSYFLEYKFSIAQYEVPLSERDGSVLFIDLWNQLISWLAGSPPGGYLYTRLTSHQVIGGLGVRLGAEPVVAP
jgi:lipid A oxidase